MSIIIDPATGGFTSNGPFGLFIQRIDTSNDSIDGSNLDDVIYAYDGDDVVNGSGSHDLIYGGDGKDKLYGGFGNDVIFGNQGDDSIDGGEGNDILYGGRGGDTIDGGSGADFISGNLGGDFIDGGAGDDTVYGGQASDTINGGSGADFISGDLGNDLITGGSGADTFSFVGDLAQLGLDTLVDFNPQEDKIQVGKELFGSNQGRAINPTEFLTVNNFNDAAAVSNAKIIYDSATGLLYYNLDSLKGNEAPFAQLQPGLSSDALFKSLEMF